MSYFTHDFIDLIAQHGVGKSRVITYKVLFLPPHFENELPFERYPRLRVEWVNQSQQISDANTMPTHIFAMVAAELLGALNDHQVSIRTCFPHSLCCLVLGTKVERFGSFLTLKLNHHHSAS